MFVTGMESLVPYTLGDGTPVARITARLLRFPDENALLSWRWTLSCIKADLMHQNEYK